jgi:protein-S-isoprenylcysteine O-methyltransferase Ste14
MANERSWPRDLPPVWLLASLLLMAGLHCLAPIAVWLPAPWRWSGVVLVAIGVLLAGTAALRFWRRGTGVRPFSPANALVAEGAFRWTRNPMYLGLTAIVLGMALGLGTVGPAVVPLAFFLLLRNRFVRREEQFLRLRFGADYDEYCRRVRRWL